MDNFQYLKRVDRAMAHQAKHSYGLNADKSSHYYGKDLRYMAKSDARRPGPIRTNPRAQASGFAHYIPPGSHFPHPLHQDQSWFQDESNHSKLNSFRTINSLRQENKAIDSQNRHLKTELSESKEKLGKTEADLAKAQDEIERLQRRVDTLTLWEARNPCRRQGEKCYRLFISEEQASRIIDAESKKKSKRSKELPSHLVLNMEGYM